jgi:hypothetical protein
MIFAVLPDPRVRRVNAFATRAQLARPSDERQKLGEYHRRRSPYFFASDTECGRDDSAAVSFSCRICHAARRHQVVERHVENAGDFSVCGGERGTRVRETDDGMQTKATDGNVDRRERAGDAHQPPVEGDFFVRLPQRSVRVRFARFDHTAWQRYLSAVTAKRICTDGQHEMRTIVRVRKNQDKSSGVAHVRALWPHTSRLWRHQRVRAATRQRFCECRNQIVGKLGKRAGSWLHGFTENVTVNVERKNAASILRVRRSLNLEHRAQPTKCFTPDTDEASGPSVE